MRDFSDGPGVVEAPAFRGVEPAGEQDAPRLRSRRKSSTSARSTTASTFTSGAPRIFEFVVAVQRLVPFELELFLRNGFETILILRKTAD